MTTAAERVENHILKMIYSGKFKPGDHIPQLPLARQLGVSNNPVIQALRKLEGRGIIERNADGTAHVRRIDPLEMYAAFVVRESLDAVAARYCAANASDEEMAVLRVRSERLVERFRKSGYSPADDMALHTTIVAFSHIGFVKHLYETTEAIRQTFHALSEGVATEAVTHHERLLAAILSRNEAAAEEEARRHAASRRELFRAQVLAPDASPRQSRTAEESAAL